MKKAIKGKFTEEKIQLFITHKKGFLTQLYSYKCVID